MTGESLRIIPHPDDPKATWYSIADLQSAAVPQVQRVRALVSALVVAYREGDRAGVQTAASALGSRLAELAPGRLPAAEGPRARGPLQPRQAVPHGLDPLPRRLPGAARELPARLAGLPSAGFALVVAGFLLPYGMLLRVLISGRPPVTNMYESIVFVAWGGVLFALIFEAIYRCASSARAPRPSRSLCLILADNVPIFDGSIAPLVPVLRDNMWLTIHVLTIMLGYAAFTLAMGIGHLNLGLYFFAPDEVVLLKTLSLFLYRALQVGTLFLAVGTLLGGVWASYSWGRFWGWDPKETWALIATLGYLAMLHGRLTGWIKDFGMAVGSLLGYLLVLMAWYGVNFVLGTGLHSYGFGSGGYWYVGGFVAFEMMVIAAALLRRRSELRKHAPPWRRRHPHTERAFLAKYLRRGARGHRTSRAAGRGARGRLLPRAENRAAGSCSAGRPAAGRRREVLEPREVLGRVDEQRLHVSRASLDEAPDAPRSSAVVTIRRIALGITR